MTLSPLEAAGFFAPPLPLPPTPPTGAALAAATGTPLTNMHGVFPVTPSHAAATCRYATNPVGTSSLAMPDTGTPAPPTAVHAPPAKSSFQMVPVHAVAGNPDSFTNLSPAGLAKLQAELPQPTAPVAVDPKNDPLAAAGFVPAPATPAAIPPATLAKGAILYNPAVRAEDQKIAQMQGGYGMGSEISHAALMGADNPIGAAVGATADWALQGQPWLSSYNQILADQTAQRQQWEQAHPVQAVAGDVLGGAVTGGTGMAKEAIPAVEGASRLVPAGKSLFEPIFTTERGIVPLARNVAAGAGVGAVSSFGMTDGNLQQRLQGALTGAEFGGGLGLAAPIFHAEPGLMGALRNTVGGAVAGGTMGFAGANGSIGNRLQAAETGALYGAGAGLTGHALALEAPRAIGAGLRAAAPMVSGAGREGAVGRQLAATVGDRPIETAPLAGVGLTMDQATNSPALAHEVRLWQSRTPATRDAASALATSNNQAIRGALGGLGNGAAPADASAAFTGTLRDAQALADREESRLWNTPTLANSRVRTAPIKSAVSNAMLTLPPGMKLGVSGQIRNAIETLSEFPAHASVGDINSIKSALWKIGQNINPDNAIEAAVGKTLSGAVYNALDAQLSSPQTDSAVRQAYAAARDFTGRSKAAFDTDRAQAAMGTETESTAARRFLSPNNGAPEGAQNIQDARQVLRSFRSSWDQLHAAGVTDAQGRSYSPDQISQAEQALKTHARTYIVGKLLDGVSMMKRDAEGDPFVSLGKLATEVQNNQGWLRSSGLFSKDQINIIDSVGKTAQLLNRTEDLRTQTGSHSAERMMDTIFSQRVLSGLGWVMKIGAGVGGFHEAGPMGAAMGVMLEHNLEGFVDRAKEASREILDKALANPAFAKQLMTKATAGNRAMLSTDTRSALQRFEGAVTAAQGAIQARLNGPASGGAMSSAQPTQ